MMRGTGHDKGHWARLGLHPAVNIQQNHHCFGTKLWVWARANIDDAEVTLGVQSPGTEVTEKNRYLCRLCSDRYTWKTRT